MIPGNHPRHRGRKGGVRNKVVVAAVLLALTVGGIVIWKDFGGVGGTGPPSALPLAAQVEVPGALDLRGVTVDSNSAARGREYSAALLVGGAHACRIVDATFSFGLSAWIVLPKSPWLVADGEGLAIMPEVDANSRIRIALDGYHDRLYEPGDRPGETVALIPRLSSSLRVLSSGVPLSGIRVSWRPLGRQEETPRGHVVETSTTQDGLAGIASAVECLATVFSPSQGVVRRIRVPVGTKVDVKLPGPGRRLQLVDVNSAEPLTGVAVVLSRPTDPQDIPNRAVSGLRGEILLDDRSHPVTVDLSTSSFTLPESLGPEWDRRSSRVAIFFGRLKPRAGQPERIVLPVVKQPIIRLVDRETGRGVNASIRFGFLRDERVSPTHPYDLPLEGVARNGMLGLPKASAASVQRMIAQSTRLYLLVDGYHPLWTYDLNALYAASGEWLVLECRPADSRSIRIVDRNSRPVTLPLFISTADKSVLLYSEGGAADGVHGPFCWFGGAVRVWWYRASVGQSKRHVDPATAASFEDVEKLVQRSRESATEELGLVSEASLAGSVEPVLIVDLATVDVEVMGVAGRTTEIVLMDHFGVTHRPSVRSDDRLQFASIPEGPVLVGPPAWVEQLWARRVYGWSQASLHVRSGEANRLAWDQRWALEGPVTGRIRYPAPGPFPLFLVPVYATTEIGFPLGPKSRSLPVMDDGNYSIPVGEASPDALLVCSLSTGGRASGGGSAVVVHDLIYSGQDADLALGELEVHWGEEEWLGPVKVYWKVPTDTFVHPDGLLLGGTGDGAAWAIWSSPEPLVLRGLPLGALPIRFFPPQGGWTQDFQIVAGERRSVTLHGRVDAH